MCWTFRGRIPKAKRGFNEYLLGTEITSRFYSTLKEVCIEDL